MPKTLAFDSHTAKYEDWYDEHPHIYESELEAVRTLLPKGGTGIEIGVGTGRFAVALDISIGLDPSPAMRAIAHSRGIEAVDGVAEAIPIEDERYDYALFVTTICFVDSLDVAFAEAYRIVKPGGFVVVGFIDKNSPLGIEYEKQKEQSTFYKDATFRSATEVETGLRKAGFKDCTFVQTIFHDMQAITAKESIKQGYGEGSFVVVRAIK